MGDGFSCRFLNTRAVSLQRGGGLRFSGRAGEGLGSSRRRHDLRLDARRWDGVRTGGRTSPVLLGVTIVTVAAGTPLLGVSPGRDRPVPVPGEQLVLCVTPPPCPFGYVTLVASSAVGTTLLSLGRAIHGVLLDRKSVV